jgi:hypothetical protein
MAQGMGASANAETGSHPADQARSGLGSASVDPARKDIRSKADRLCKPSKIPTGETAEAFARDWTRNCEVCAEKPVVNVTGLCGPCTFGEAETYGGNW